MSSQVWWPVPPLGQKVLGGLWTRCPRGWAETVLCVMRSGAKTEMSVFGPEKSLVSSAHQKQSRSDVRAQLGGSGHLLHRHKWEP